MHRAVSRVLSEGFRTADIFQPGTHKVGTREIDQAPERIDRIALRAKV